MPSTFLHERPTDESHSPILPVRSLQLMPLPFFVSKKMKIKTETNFYFNLNNRKKIILQVGDASVLSKYCVGPQLIKFHSSKLKQKKSNRIQIFTCKF
jgi:hypothetical protein